MRKRPSMPVILITFLLFCVPLSAHADDPAVAKQLYDLSGRLEIILTPSMSVFDKYTRHVGTSLGLAYFLNDYIGFEVEGGYAFFSTDRKLLDEILETSTELHDDVDPSRNIEKLPLTDLKRMTWWAMGGLVFNPLYGKLNFSAELAVSIHFYLVGGAGVAEYHYTELDHSSSCGNFDGFCKEDVKYDGGIHPSFYFGGGVRFHIGQHWSMRLEVRDVFFYDEYTAHYKESGLNRTDKKIEDFVHNTFLRIGVGYAF
jgi:outer membrane beta-barrel protein